MLISQATKLSDTSKEWLIILNEQNEVTIDISWDGNPWLHFENPPMDATDIPTYEVTIALKKDGVEIPGVFLFEHFNADTRTEIDTYIEELKKEIEELGYIVSI